MTDQRERIPAASLLDNPEWSSLTGTHGHLGEIVGAAGRYLTDVAPHAALRDQTDPGAWRDLRGLLGPGTQVLLAGLPFVPPGWDVVDDIPCLQFVDTGLRAEPDPEAVRLGPADVPEMLDLVRQTQPGPFRPRTVELGTYLGIRRDGALVAMAGERLRPPGWTEISAVCTDARYQGQGLATRLIRAVAAGIRDRGDTPFLHTMTTNRSAIQLYEKLGFTLRRPTRFRVLRHLET
jgi:ribosomal protein S18 acetylase RimI-like enzyme